MVLRTQEAMNTIGRCSRCVAFCIFAPQLPITDTHSTALRQRRSGYSMGAGGQTCKSAVERNKMRMVRRRMEYMVNIHDIYL